MIAIKILRACFIRGEIFAAGETLEVSPLDAHNCIGSSRAALVDPQDASEVAAAARREMERESQRLLKERPTYWSRKNNL